MCFANSNVLKQILGTVPLKRLPPLFLTHYCISRIMQLNCVIRTSLSVSPGERQRQKEGGNSSEEASQWNLSKNQFSLKGLTLPHCTQHPTSLCLPYILMHFFYSTLSIFLFQIMAINAD